MARRIGFFPIMVASFAITVALTGPFGIRSAEPAKTTAAAPIDAKATSQPVGWR